MMQSRPLRNKTHALKFIEDYLMNVLIKSSGENKRLQRVLHDVRGGRVSDRVMSYVREKADDPEEIRQWEDVKGVLDVYSG